MQRPTSGTCAYGTRETLSFSPDAVVSIARRLLGEPNRRLSSQRDLRFGNRGSLSVIPARGVFFDNEGGGSGGVLDLVIWAGAAKSKGEALRFLRDGGEVALPETVEDRAERAEAEERRVRRRRATARRIWCQGVSLRQTAALRYLRMARGVEAPLREADLRFHPAAPEHPYLERSEVRPALLAAVRDAGGQLTGLHLTYLAEDGLAKASTAANRRMVGTVGGGHVRLIPGDAVVVAEGIESVLSAWEQVAHLNPPGELGAIAALSATGMARLRWPPGTRALVLAHDRDPNGAGEAAAKELATRATAHGIGVSMFPPPEGLSDWNETVRRDRRPQ